MRILGFPFSQRNGKGQGVIRQRAGECDGNENAFAHNRTVTEYAITDVFNRTA